MKKKAKKLVLSRETVVNLEGMDMERVQGGSGTPTDTPVCQSWLGTCGCPSTKPTC